MTKRIISIIYSLDLCYLWFTWTFFLLCHFVMYYYNNETHKKASQQGYQINALTLMKYKGMLSNNYYVIAYHGSVRAILLQNNCVHDRNQADISYVLFDLLRV